jgi:hypothetical protein
MGNIIASTKKSKNGTYGSPQIYSVTHISTHKLQIDNLWYALIGSKNFLEIEGMKCEREREEEYYLVMYPKLRLSFV